MKADFTASLAAWLDLHLVPQWRHFWKLWSTWLAGLAGMVGAYFADPANAASWTATLYGIPPEYRKFIPAGMFLLVASVPTIVRLWRQKHLPPPPSPPNG